jgi:pimeloyl-ACP methyl ester carboxylesterase
MYPARNGEIRIARFRSAFFRIGAAIFFLFYTDLVRAQVTPPEGTVPTAVAGDTRKNPSSSKSQLEIFANGQWSTDLDSQFDPGKPTLVLIHGWQPGNLEENGNLVHSDITEYWSNVTTALATRVNAEGQTGDINLLGWNWMPLASTREIDPLIKTTVTVPAFAVYNEALLLANKLKSLAPQGTIQLYGHSLGAKLAAVTGVAAQAGDDAIAIDHVVMVDGPELNTSDYDLQGIVMTVPVHLENEIPQLMQKNTYAEAYVSAFSFCYSELGIGNLNIDMQSNTGVFQFVEQIVGSHRLPIVWYFGGTIESIGTYTGTIDAATGNVSSSMGAAWSKVLNRTATTPDIEAARTKMLEGTNDDIAQKGMNYGIIDRVKNPYDLLETNTLQAQRVLTETAIPFTLDGSVEWTRSGDVAFDNSESPQAVLTASSAGYLMGKMTVPSGNVVLNFTLTIDNPDPTDKFTIFFDNQLILTLDAGACRKGSSLAIGPVELTPFEQKTGTLTFCYTSASTGKIARLSDMKVTSWPYRSFKRLKVRKALGHGTFYPEHHYYTEGSTVTLHAFPIAGFRVWKWEGSDSDTLLHTDLNTVTLNDSKIVSVRFQLDWSDLPCSISGLAVVMFMGLGMVRFAPGNASEKKDD